MAESILKPETPQWHTPRIEFWREEVAARAERVIVAQEEFEAAKRALREHEDAIKEESA